MKKIPTYSDALVVIQAADTLLAALEIFEGLVPPSYQRALTSISNSVLVRSRRDFTDLPSEAILTDEQLDEIEDRRLRHAFSTWRAANEQE